MNYVKKLEVELEYKKACLKGKAESLRSRMDNLIKRIDNDKLGTLNSLGEVQSMGLEVDRYCIQIGVLQDLIESYPAYHKENKEEN